MFPISKLDIIKQKMQANSKPTRIELKKFTANFYKISAADFSVILNYCFFFAVAFEKYESLCVNKHTYELLQGISTVLSLV